MTIPLGRLLPAASSDLPERQDETSPLPEGTAFLSGLAPDGVYPAAPVASGAVRSYRTVSPLPLKNGGLFSVALSLRLPSPGVTRHRGSVEPGLSSVLQQRPSSHLTLGEDAAKPWGMSSGMGTAGLSLRLSLQSLPEEIPIRAIDLLFGQAWPYRW